MTAKKPAPSPDARWQGIVSSKHARLDQGCLDLHIAPEQLVNQSFETSMQSPALRIGTGQHTAVRVFRFYCDASIQWGFREQGLTES